MTNDSCIISCYHTHHFGYRSNLGAGQLSHDTMRRFHKRLHDFFIYFTCSFSKRRNRIWINCWTRCPHEALDEDSTAFNVKRVLARDYLNLLSINPSKPDQLSTDISIFAGHQDPPSTIADNNRRHARRCFVRYLWCVMRSRRDSPSVRTCDLSSVVANRRRRRSHDRRHVDRFVSYVIRDECFSTKQIKHITNACL